MGDRELAVGNTSKCEEEKIKGENGKKAAINLTRESHKSCLDKKSNLINSLNFPKFFYSIILKELIRHFMVPTHPHPYGRIIIWLIGVGCQLSSQLRILF